MWFARIATSLALLIWGFFAFVGLDAMSDAVAQRIPGFPNSAQRNYYVYFPLAMTALSMALAAAAWRTNKSTPVGCSALLVLGIWFIYLLPYTGGV